jgi:hydroxyacylglutathione hydrolase
VFTGDALFVGDVGRTDFYPERPEEVAGLLYDSIHGKLLTLGDQALVYPAHGAGSVCGESMASREFSSLGHERRNNPRLQLSREDFIRAKLGEQHYQPPYFRRMEELNKGGSPRMDRLPTPAPIEPDELAERIAARRLVLVDVRSPEAYAGVFIPGSIALPLALLSGYAGWFLPYDRPFCLVAQDDHDERDAVEQLVRMGYTRIEHRLRGGLSAWEKSGREYQSIPAVSAATVRDRLNNREPFTLLDVRKLSEYRAGHLPGAHHCFLGELPQHERLHELPVPIVTFCGSGQRALVAASLLRRAGVHEVENCFGSMAACQAVGCPIEEGS